MASLIRAEIARLLISEVSDPRLRHLVITEVELTKDLRLARVYYELGEGSDTKEVNRGLHSASAFFRRKLGTNLDLKYVPELVFETDEHSHKLNHLLSVLDKVSRESHPVSPGAEHE